jgi:predicted methyltransferase
MPVDFPRLASVWLSAGLAFGLAACSPGERTTGSRAVAETPGPAVGSLQWAAAGEWRMPAETARDQWRNPVATLTFFGIKPTDTVVELFPGGGWYSAILGPYLKQGGGRLIAALADPDASPSARAAWDAYQAAFADKPGTFGTISLSVASRDSAGIAPDGSADAVLTFRNVHNWMRGGYADKIFADAYRALKPGGVLGVEEHRLPSNRDQDLIASSGYVQQSYVIQLAENAGFVFEEASEINANPRDTADHPLGVWMLPPSLRKPDAGTPEAASYDEARYKAIGESDRMTLRFRKPVPAPVAGP